MDESKKEILEKEKIYHEKKKARTLIYIVIGVLIIYAFFFTSKLTIPQPITSEKDVTALGVEEEYTENRSVTLVSAESVSYTHLDVYKRQEETFQCCTSRISR